MMFSRVSLKMKSGEESGVGQRRRRERGGTSPLDNTKRVGGKDCPGGGGEWNIVSGAGKKRRPKEKKERRDRYIQAPESWSPGMQLLRSLNSISLLLSSFILHMFIEYLLCTGSCPRSWECYYKKKKKKKGPSHRELVCEYGVGKLEEEHNACVTYIAC